MKLRSRVLGLVPRVHAKLSRNDLARSRWFRRAYAEAYFLYKRFAEDPFLQLLNKHPELFRGGHILDVGANIGYTALVFARALSPGYKVFAFEPEPVNFEALEEIVQMRGLKPKIEAIFSAVGETSGYVSLWVNEDHRADHRVLTPFFEKNLRGGYQVQRVPLTSLDAFAEARLGVEAEISFVKVDVQGYEIGVLRGMKRILARRTTAFAFEYLPALNAELGFDSGELLSTFREAGYSITTLERSGRLELVTDTVLARALEDSGYVDLLMTPKPIR